MTELPPPISAYLRAYDARDVPGMIACLAQDVRFRNISGGAVNAQADGREAFREMAEFGARAFSERAQTVLSAITVADTTLVRIGYRAVVARDLPNGWKAGQNLAFEGASLYRLRDGLIAELIDES